MEGKLKIFSGTSHPELAKEVCDYLGMHLGEIHIERFSNDNLFVQVLENARECDVFVMQTSAPPVNEGIFELLMILDALRSASASRTTAVIPAFPYARSDKKDMPRISITARMVADLLATAGADRVLTMTLHSPQVHGFFAVPTDHLAATPVLCEYFAKLDLADFVAVAPDAGSAKRAGTYAQWLNLPLAFVDKRRVGDDNVEIRGIVGDVRGKKAIIFDDEIATGASLLESVNALTKSGVTEIYFGATHGVLSGNAIQRIQEMPIREVVITNTIPIPAEKRIDKLKVLSVAPLFAEAIRRIHTGESVSQLFL